jgi:hypothetical protein
VLNWQASAGAKVYRVYRAASPAGASRATFLGWTSATTFSAPTGTVGASYNYWVQAVATGKTSSRSSPALDGDSPTPVPSDALPISSGEAASGSVAQNQWAYYYLDVPTNATSVTLSMSGTNDADLYLRRSQYPTRSQYDQRSYNGTSSENIVVDGTSSVPLQPGQRYYIGVNGYSVATASYWLTVSVTLATPDGASVQGLFFETATYGPMRYYPVKVPAGATKLDLALVGDQKPIFLIRQGAQPTLSQYDVGVARSGATVGSLTPFSNPSLVTNTTYWIGISSSAPYTLWWNIEAPQGGGTPDHLLPKAVLLHKYVHSAGSPTVEIGSFARSGIRGLFGRLDGGTWVKLRLDAALRWSDTLTGLSPGEHTLEFITVDGLGRHSPTLNVPITTGTP